MNKIDAATLTVKIGGAAIGVPDAAIDAMVDIIDPCGGVESMAARVDDEIGHETLMGTFLKKGSGLISALVSTAVSFVIDYAVKVVVGAAATAAGIASCGVGTVLVLAAGLVIGEALNRCGVHEKIHDVIDGAMQSLAEYFPPAPTGQIDAGSSDVHINDKDAALTIDSLVTCNKCATSLIYAIWAMVKSMDSIKAAEGAKHVRLNDEHLHRKDDKLSCGGFTLESSENVHVGGPPLARCPIMQSPLEWVLENAKMIVFVVSTAIQIGKGIKAIKEGMKAGKSLLCAAGAVLSPIVTNFAFQYGMSLAQSGISKLFDLFTGKPVNVLSGAKFLDGPDDTDFSLPSALPVIWTRRYSSLNQSESPFGPGWSLDYTMSLKVNQTGEYPVVFSGHMGRELGLAAVNPGERRACIDENLALMRTQGGQYIIDDRDGVFYCFADSSGNVCPPDGIPATLRLDTIEDRNGNRISLRYDAQGRLSSFSDSAGRLLECVPHEKFPQRIGAMRVCNFDYQAGEQNWRVLSQYDYDEKGRLTSVFNALGEETRRFSWHDCGPGAGLMASHTLQSGLESFYEWTAAPDHPRVSRHYLSDGQSWSFSYDFHENGGGTTVTDVLGNRRHWEWGLQYRPLSHVNEVGETWRIEWNENDLPIRLTLPNGGVCENQYDQSGLLISQTDAMGNVEQFSWHPELETMTSYTDQSGAVWQYEYDERGNLVAETGPNGGLTHYALDIKGRLIAKTEADGKISAYDYDKYDLLRRYTDCAGNISSYEYDDNCLLIDAVDALGQRTVTSRDVLGRVAGLKLADGATYAYSWNKQGLFEKSIDPKGGTSSLEYNRCGQLVSETNELGHSLRYAYDQRGKLKSLTNENGEKYSFAYDPAGRQISQTGLDGLTTAYELDALGLPVAVRRAAGSADEALIRLERDLNGQLISKATAEYVTDYSYDTRGYLTGIKRIDTEGTFVDELSFKYDLNGNLIEEKTIEPAPGGQRRETVLKYEYDLKGRLIRTVLPDGRALVSDLCGCGYELRISLAEKKGGAETLLAAFQRDALHRESGRIQGRQQVASKYDPLSRLKSRGNRRRPDLINSLGELTTIEKSYEYDLNGELVESRDGFSGQRLYQYDAAGRLTSAAAGRVGGEFKSGVNKLQHQARKAAEQLLSEENFSYDAASNLMATGTDGPLTIRPTRQSDFGGIPVSDGGGSAKFVRHNRLTSFEGFSFKYDGLGRTVEKSHDGSGRRWRFRYNSEDQLVSVQTVDGAKISLIRFKYDALGRRTAKSDGVSETRFTWSGMRLLEEAGGENKISYVYEQGGYVPLARIDGWNETHFEQEKRPCPEGIQGIYYFHNNASGQPEEVTDQDGKIVWRGRYSAWGRLLYEEGELKQNLRMQGQYHDREIDLCYNTFRYYDSDIGRFTTEDPIGLGGGHNLYQYAPNPIAWIDPWGWASEYKLNSPYHGPKPVYENPGHHDLNSGGNFRGGGSMTTPLPADAATVYRKAVPGNSDGTTWYGANDTGEIYRYQESNGKAHWNGREDSPRGLSDIPKEVKDRLQPDATKSEKKGKRKSNRKKGGKGC